jgi:hypothetical protein
MCCFPRDFHAKNRCFSVPERIFSRKYFIGLQKISEDYKVTRKKALKKITISEYCSFKDDPACCVYSNFSLFFGTSDENEMPLKTKGSGQSLGPVAE